MEALSKSVNKHILEFLGEVANKYSLNKDELKDMWTGVSSTPQNEVKEKKTKKKTAPRSKEKKTDENVVICNYIFTAKSKTPGKQCTTKACEGSTTCKKHQSSTTPKTTEKKTSKKSEETSTPPVIKKIEDSKPTFVVKKNADGYFVYNQTGLVLNSEKKVYARYVKGENETSGKLVDLTAEDLELCKQHNLKAEVPKHLKGENEDNNNETDSEIEDSEEESDDE